MKLCVWKNADGLHLSRPPKPSNPVELDFDPDQSCRQCGERVLSISVDISNICPWCESGMNRPKMLRYQELEIVRLLQKQSDENRDLQPPTRRPLLRNGHTEKDLRDYLTSNGYYGNSANMLQLDLKAIERPGWVQVFEFRVHAKRLDEEHCSKWEELRGFCRTDERTAQFDVEYFDTTTRDTVLKAASDGLITANRAPRHWTYWPLMATFAFTLGTAIVGAVLSSEPASGTTAESAEGEQ